MKIKAKLLTLIVICVFPTISFGQDATNKRTWNETIEFINKYSSQFQYLDDCEEDDYKGTIKINGDYLERKTFTKNGGYYYHKADLSFLNKVKSMQTEQFTRLYFTGNHVECKGKYVSDDGNETPTDERKSVLVFSICDVDLEKRIERAFEHLAFLARKKRDQKKCRI